MYSISNDFLEMSVSSLGAEIQSLKNKSNNKEYIWQADPKFWAKRSPVLFPIIGELKGGTYLYKDKLFNMPKHGFARDLNFELVTLKGSSIQLVLRSSEFTKTFYPFEFEFFITYSLVASKMTCTYEVNNIGSDDMYFCLGAHPAFLLPITEGKGLEEFSLVFDHDVVLNRFYLKEGLISTSYDSVVLDNQVLNCYASMFDQDAWVIKTLNSRSIRLRNKSEEYSVQVDFEGFDSLGLWSVPDSQFLCIEPWCGYNDSILSNGNIENKEGIIRLEKERKIEKNWAVSLMF